MIRYATPIPKADRRTFASASVAEIDFGLATSGGGRFELIFHGTSIEMRQATIDDDDSEAAMRAEIDRLMPSIAELSEMVTEMPREWLDDHAWDDYESR